MIGMHCPINNLGYGVHSYNLAKALTDLGHKVAVFPPSGRINLPEDEYIRQWISNQESCTRWHPAVMIYHAQFMRQFSGSTRIAFPVFELDKLTNKELAAIATCDMVMQPSLWGAGVLRANGIINPVHVVPEGYDPTVFFPARSKEEMIRSLESKGPRFIHIGKFEMRKSTREIMEAFTAMSGHGTPWTLTAHIHDPFNPAWLQKASEMLQDMGWRRSQNTIWLMKDKSIHIPELPFQNQAQVAEMISKHHFGIWASKAEGWNLPLVETIACGVPSFTTPWTGMSEYVSKEAWGEAFIFDEFTVQEANDGRWFHGDQGNWNCPDLAQMISKLKWVLDSPKMHYDWGRDKALELAKKLTWEESGKAFVKACKLEEVDFD